MTVTIEPMVAQLDQQIAQDPLDRARSEGSAAPAGDGSVVGVRDGADRDVLPVRAGIGVVVRIAAVEQVRAALVVPGTPGAHRPEHRS